MRVRLVSHGTDRVREAQDRLDSSRTAVTVHNPRLTPGEVAELYQRHSQDLQSFLTGVLRNRELAAEALQVTFAKLLEAAGTDVQDLKGWLFRVAFHEAINIRRKQQLDQNCLKQVAWTLERTADSASRAEALRAEDQLVRREEVERVRAVLETLPAEQQQIVRMRIYDEQTFQSIADELGLPLGTVLSRMRLALHKLELKLQ